LAALDRGGLEVLTGGRLLADRSLSRLLREDWPRSLEEPEQYKHDRRLAPGQVD
jgi:hypothetical protein